MCSQLNLDWLHSHTIFSDMSSDFGHGVADIGIRVEQVVMLVSLPIRKGWQLLGDGLEKTHDNPDGRGLHVIAELLHGSRILTMALAGHISRITAELRNLREHGNGSQTASPPILRAEWMPE